MAPNRSPTFRTPLSTELRARELSACIGRNYRFIEYKRRQDGEERPKATRERAANFRMAIGLGFRTFPPISFQASEVFYSLPRMRWQSSIAFAKVYGEL